MSEWGFLIRHLATNRLIQGLIIASVGAAGIYIYSVRLRVVEDESPSVDPDSPSLELNTPPILFLAPGLPNATAGAVLSRVRDHLQDELTLATIRGNRRNIEILQQAEGIMQNLVAKVEAREKREQGGLPQDLPPEPVVKKHRKKKSQMPRKATKQKLLFTRLSPTEIMLERAAALLKEHVSGQSGEKPQPKPKTSSQPVPSTSTGITHDVAIQAIARQRAIACQIRVKQTTQCVGTDDMPDYDDEQSYEEELGSRSPAEGESAQASAGTSQTASIQTDEVLSYFDRTVDELEYDLDEDPPVSQPATSTTATTTTRGSTPSTDTESLLERERRAERAERAGSTFSSSVFSPVGSRARDLFLESVNQPIIQVGVGREVREDGVVREVIDEEPRQSGEGVEDEEVVPFDSNNAQREEESLDTDDDNSESLPHDEA